MPTKVKPKAKKAAPKKPAVAAKKATAPTDAEIQAQKDHVNSLKDQYLAEYDKLNAMRAKRKEADG